MFRCPQAILSDALDGERRERAFADARHDGLIFGEIDDRARLDAAGSGVDDEIQLVLELCPDFLRIRERRRISRERQRGGDDRLVPPGQQGAPPPVTPHPPPDPLAARMPNPPPPPAPPPPAHPTPPPPHPPRHPQ